MRGSLAWLVVLAVATSASSAGADPVPSPADTVVLRVPPEPLTRDLVGFYVSDADPGALVIIESAFRGVVNVHAGARFLATGFFDGRTFVGVRRTPADAAPDVAARFGVLRMRLAEPGRLSVEFADAFDAPARTRETWTRQGRPGVPAARPTEAGLPALGEYVYVEELPEAIERVPPDYPVWARQKNVSGTVLVQALVGKDGAVHDVKVVKSIPELDDYAVAAVKQWRFKPATAKGSPVAVWVAIPVKFTLH